MNAPNVIIEENFQSAYFNAVTYLSTQHWELYNLIVQITNPLLFDNEINNGFTDFSKNNNISSPKIVSSTIFPENLYLLSNTREDLYRKYINRLYPKAKFGNWGTYFHRMISYPINGNSINQLENIITKINSRVYHSKAAFTIYIQVPGNETVRKMGAPCLNYAAVQIESNKIGLLAVYRNHDFLKKAYGNYLGLCNLIKFLSMETNMDAGPLTCISSHAYIEKYKHSLLNFIDGIENENA